MLLLLKDVVCIGEDKRETGVGWVEARDEEPVEEAIEAKEFGVVFDKTDELDEFGVLVEEERAKEAGVICWDNGGWKTTAG